MRSVINKQFIKAAKDNQLDELKNLLSQGADIHINNSEALREAAYYGYFEIVKILIEQGANIHSSDDYALRFSALNGHLETIKFLVTQGANIHANNDEALRWSARFGRLEVVNFLIAHGADIHAKNDEALKNAAIGNHNDVWQVLSAFTQEEKLLVAALDFMLVLPAVGSVALVAVADSTSASTWGGAALGSVAKNQKTSMLKIKRSKI